jgi:GTP-binding protein EngB required for normal cell division
MPMRDSYSAGNPDPVADEYAPALFGTVSDVIRRFGMGNLEPETRVCATLIGDQAALDVAVLGQFKSGKSSLLNALIGSDLLPVGVTPVTAVITRLCAGPVLAAHVTHLDGRVENIAIERIAEFATEALNPSNRRRVARVDIATPALSSWANLRLVDTPGLGSTFAHNTQATRDWLPNIAAALVVISADRPLSDDERALIADVRQLVPRMWIILSKIDLFSSEQQTELVTFLRDRLRQYLLHDIPVLPFSVRQDRERWLSQLREEVFRPLIEDPTREARSVFVHKVRRLAKACGDYLQIARRAAIRVAADRERLRAAILDETVREAVIADELVLASNRVCADFSKVVWPRFESLIDLIQRRLVEGLRTEMPIWRGHLGRQTGAYEVWIRESLTAELLKVSATGAPLACQLVEQAETRFRRIVEAFRDRLGRNVAKTLNLSLSPVSWDVRAPAVIAPDPSFSRTFDTNWELLWWAIPMPLFGWLFRRHFLGMVPWEVEKNLRRLNSDWYEAVQVAVNNLREQALAWVRAEISTIGQILDRTSDDAPAIEDGIRRLEAGLALISSP